jgi:hypothetical protein
MTSGTRYRDLLIDYRDPQLDTGELGGVDAPDPEQLAQMQRAQYVFHARGGKLTRHAVEKVLLPRALTEMPRA